ncbi:DUF4190 domain-containing protein [Clostridium sp. 001]|uniref:DUF4190 domain-containing protein n=1 Tax=Clostridium sp. 001 TaxID=1970093 RepID=UPI001C2C363F|nr:DUF4190 domain-containing protein [Clostridium sp. 001]QXE19542.1 hypothetical protein B5S50_12325 [Clostridium sp. 001]
METTEKPKSKKGITSFILGIIGLIVWIIPIIGAPVTIIGLILGIKSHNSNHKKLAIAGIVLCTIGLFLTIVNGAIGAYKGGTGTLFNSNTTNNSSSNVAATTDESKQSIKKITFCEKIDNNLNPTNTKDNFNIGEKCYARLDNKAPFKSSKLKLAIYKLNGNSESVFFSQEQDMDQDNTILAVPLNIDTAGKYKITITRSSNDQKLGEGEVTIQ